MFMTENYIAKSKLCELQSDASKCPDKDFTIAYPIGLNKLPSLIPERSQAESLEIINNFCLYYFNQTPSYLTNCFTSGIINLLETICKEDQKSEIAIMDPGFEMYQHYVTDVKAKPQFYQQALTGEINFTNLEQLINKNTKAIIIASPDNPRGSSIDFLQLEKLCQTCSKHGIHLIIDQTFALLNFEKDSNPSDLLNFVSSFSTLEYTVITDTGKFIHTDKKLTCIFSTIEIPNLPSAKIDYFAEMIESLNLDNNLAIVRSAIETNFKVLKTKSPNIEVLQQNPSSIALVDISKTNMSANEFINKSFFEHGYSFIAGEVFGANTRSKDIMSSYIRIALARDPEEFKKMLDQVF